MHVYYNTAHGRNRKSYFAHCSRCRTLRRKSKGGVGFGLSSVAQQMSAYSESLSCSAHVPQHQASTTCGIRSVAFYVGALLEEKETARPGIEPGTTPYMRDALPLSYPAGLWKNHQLQHALQRIGVCRKVGSATGHRVELVLGGGELSVVAGDGRGVFQVRE